jgi:hypothetical protein
LPVEAVRCPVCGLKRGFRRLFDTVQVGGARDQAKMVDQYAVKALEEVRRGAPSYKPEFRSAPVAAQAAMGMIGHGAEFSRARNVPALLGLQAVGGPRPGPGSRQG